MQRGEIIAIGSELLLGGRLDTNSIFLSDGLASAGIEVRFKTVVGDVEDDIVATLRTAARRADVVLLTGGLGPTSDDCTREAVARATGRPLRRRAEAVEGMRRRLAAWGRTPSAAQQRQGLIPAGAEVLANPVGSAPGFALRWKGALIAALPGVPAEAERMFAAILAPMLQREIVSGRTERPERIERLVLRTVGLPESELEQRIAGLLPRSGCIRLGLLASPLGVVLSLTAVVSESRQGRHQLDQLERVFRTIRKKLGRHVYAEGPDTMEQVVGRYLASRGLVLALAESCTGGLIGHRLTQVPGSSAYLDRGVVCYSNRAKTELLGVPERLLITHGAVSAPVAASMAKGVRARSRASVGLSVTGIAGPGGGTAKKPVGLVYVGLDTARSKAGQVSKTQAFRFHGTRETIKLRASQAALNMLREWLASTGPLGGP
ncbi:MAG: competence/damage-inducible protein A [Nitrospirae bacterium]|nr:MAG: competence/damage-inducible protein A [Nitrospirota bacterium]